MTPAEAISLLIACIAGIVAVSTAFAQIGSQRTIAQLTSQLRISEDKQRILFSSLHTKRIEVVSKLYTLLNQMEGDLTSLVYAITQGNNSETLRDRQSQAFRSVKDFTQYFGENRIWIDRDICKSIESILEIALLVQIQGIGLRSPKEDGIQDDFMERLQDIVRTDLPEVRRRIDEGFRLLLGDEVKLLNDGQDRLNNSSSDDTKAIEPPK